jgi:uncharacterized protein (TIGR02600 family)
MKAPHSSENRNSHRGVALVIVLAFLVLLSSVVIAFYSSVSTDLKSSETYASGVSVKQLSDSAVNLVMGQIVDATKGWVVPGDPEKGIQPDKQRGRQTWSSQPGLIRTWTDQPVPGSRRARPGRTYKLYSSLNMVQEPGNAPFNPIEELGRELGGHLNDWPAKPSLVTDLNQPVLVKDPLGGIQPYGASGASYSAQFPILDPLGVDRRSAWNQPLRENEIAGFKIRSDTPESLMPNDFKAPGYVGGDYTERSDPTASGRADKTANPVPMPVVWLYVLKNGMITAPAGVDADDVTVHWDNLSPQSPYKPTKDNPIVGRIAFWTDDETCKLNLNTAGEGVWWDRPWGDGGDERSFASNIPRQNEFQRYPGHPATTSLSAVFGGAFNVPLRAPSTAAVMLPYVGASSTARSISPRLNFPLDLENYGGSGSRVRLRGDRLYGSVDELLFRIPSAPTSDPDPKEDRVPFDSKINRSFIERAKFFVTASSRAPEVNLFNLPRICLWPLQANAPVLGNSRGNVDNPDGSPWRNSKDKLIAFCTSTKSVDQATGASKAFPYYFQRYSIYDRRTDGRSTLQNPIPSSYQWRDDWKLIPRNVELYTYLRDTLAGAAQGPNHRVPGYGREIASKYPNDLDQILTSMFDTIRGGLNSYNTSEQPFYEYLPPRAQPSSGGTFPRPGETQAVPFLNPQYPSPEPLLNDPDFEEKMTTLDGEENLIPHARGFGRWMTITEVAILFYCSAKSQATRQPTEMGAVIILEPFNPSIGPASWSLHGRFKIKNLDKLRVRLRRDIDSTAGVETSLNFPADAVNLVTSRVGFSGGGHTTALMGLQSFFRRLGGANNDSPKTIGFRGRGHTFHPENDYPFHSQESINISGFSSFDFLGGPLEIEIYHGYGSATAPARPDALVQTVHVNFPAVTGLPVPSGDETNFANRIANNDDWRNRFISRGDIVRSVEANTEPPHSGDLRFFSAVFEVPSKWFSAAPGYDNASFPIVHSLRQTCWIDDQFPVQRGTRENDFRKQPVQQTSGRLVPGGSDPQQRFPVVPRGLNGAFTPGVRPGDPPVRGDWDTGVGYLEDGPYINKPDEGNVATGLASYFGRGSFANEQGTTFSPNRQVASGVVFGSLPTGIFSGRPWQTLLFNPFPAAGDCSWRATNPPHFGATEVPDHVFLDFFTMPIVEPYAISEPFSTAGKVNLNYQIAPFTYIKRQTALRGVLQSVRMQGLSAPAVAVPQRSYVNLDETLLGFEKRFEANRPFISASEICEMPLVPLLSTRLEEDKMREWWLGRQYTGDNVRESPYNHIYPRVTTKSNTFTVHVRVQTLKKANPPGGLSPEDQEEWWSEWNESKDKVLSEYRGSTTIERYIDASDPRLPDFANRNTLLTLDDFYKFRIVATKRFNP